MSVASATHVEQSADARLATETSEQHREQADVEAGVSSAAIAVDVVVYGGVISSGSVQGTYLLREMTRIDSPAG